MRFDENITFVAETNSHYDPDIGEYVDGGKHELVVVARVTRPTKEQRPLLFGDQTTNQIVVHPKAPVVEPYSYTVWQGDKYHFVSQTTVGRRQIIYMRGDQNGANP